VKAFNQILVATAIFFGLISPAYAADDALLILGIRTVEGDDDFTNGLTAALRDQAAKFKDWNISQRALSLDQMTLAYNCEELDAACLSKIAAGLGVRRIIYGTCRRNSARDTYDYIVALGLFDAESGAIEDNATDILSSSKTNKNDLASSAAVLLSELRARSLKGTVVAIRSNVNGAEVRIDDNRAGVIDNGLSVIHDIAPGEHTVEIINEGYEPYRKPVSVPKGELTTVIAPLCPVGGCGARPLVASKTQSRSGGAPKWLPYAFFGLSGLSLAGMVVSWVWISSIENDQDYKDYRARVSENKAGVNVCEEAKNGLAYAVPGSPEYGKFSDVQKMCAHGGTLEVMQFVFLGAALVSGGIGAYLLLTQKGAEDKEPEVKSGILASQLSLQPLINRRSIGLNASIAF
jgi:hypothetical protein